MFKKAVSPVVAMALLLVVTVVAVTFFQTWFATYSSNIFSDTEQRSTISSDVSIESVIAGTLYVINNKDVELVLSALKIGNETCNTSINVSPGINEIDVSECLLELDGAVQDVVIISSNQVVVKQVLVDILALSGGGSCSVIDADSDGIVDWLDDNDSSFNAVCSANNEGFCFLNESAKSDLDTDLVTGNIKSGATIFGVAGELESLVWVQNGVNTDCPTACGSLNPVKFGTDSYLCYFYCDSRGQYLFGTNFDSWDGCAAGYSCLNYDDDFFCGCK